jgi:hypothetical protein
MSRNHLLGVVGVLLLVGAALAGCGEEPSPTPQPEYSPLTSPVETPTAVPTPVPTLSTCANGCINPSEDCLIKGVVTGMGGRYYYLPDMPRYNDVIVLVKYGGRWFCTVEEATANGFQKAPVE